MARGSISLRGLPELKKVLRALKPLVKEETRIAAFKGARAVGMRARTMAPRDRGILASDITSRPHKSKPIAYAGIPKEAESAPYAAPTEFGTAEVDAQPFLFPALEAEQQNHLNRIGAAINTAVKKVAG